MQWTGRKGGALPAGSVVWPVTPVHPGIVFFSPPITGIVKSLILYQCLNLNFPMSINLGLYVSHNSF